MQMDGSFLMLSWGVSLATYYDASGKGTRPKGNNFDQWWS